jgi:hypothetical protein
MKIYILHSHRYVKQKIDCSRVILIKYSGHLANLPHLSGLVVLLHEFTQCLLFSPGRYGLAGRRIDCHQSNCYGLLTAFTKIYPI